MSNADSGTDRGAAGCSGLFPELETFVWGEVSDDVEQISEILILCLAFDNELEHSDSTMPFVGAVEEVGERSIPDNLTTKAITYPR